ncbi:Uncharacterised protein [Serratia quinivorans]|nr:Uncharacterised protein [Serratia quinivorans]
MCFRGMKGKQSAVCATDKVTAQDRRGMLNFCSPSESAFPFSLRAHPYAAQDVAYIQASSLCSSGMSPEKSTHGLSPKSSACLMSAS